jgi:hypothetical protein
VAIDTEAEFDWTGPFKRTHTGVTNLRNQALAQEVFDRFGVRPVYLIDYAVATQAEGYLPLREIVGSGRCEIGAHLHPWINPPFDEQLNDYTSFSHNLPIPLQAEKLKRLTEAITSNLGVQPISYRAGRYGIGEEIATILERLDYRIDMSVLPAIDMRRIFGPDFRKALDTPYWFGDNCRMLEIPANQSFTGLLAHPILFKKVGMRVYEHISKPSVNKLRSLGIFAKLHLLERVPVSPEGTTLLELRRVTRKLLKDGKRVLVLSYHSSSLLPGSTEYVRSGSDLARFLKAIEDYLSFFFAELRGISMTPTEFRRSLLQTRAVCGDAGLQKEDEKGIIPARMEAAP